MSESLLAIILGIIQGLTEFLPVSSSGHLEIAKYIFSDRNLPEQSLLMTVVLHFGTAMSTLVVFRKDIFELLRGLVPFKKNDESTYTLKIILSMVPAALVGLMWEAEIESMFNQNMLLVGLALLVTAVLLFFAEKAKNAGKEVGFRDALMIGLAQAVAITPGISRSGATISASLLLGIDREKAARFSFLMVVPLIFGKMAKDLLNGKVSMQDTSFIPLIAGFSAAFLTGLFACMLMIRVVKMSKLSYFAMYCLIVAAIAISEHFQLW